MTKKAKIQKKQKEDLETIQKKYCGGCEESGAQFKVRKRQRSEANTGESQDERKRLQQDVHKQSREGYSGNKQGQPGPIML